MSFAALLDPVVRTEIYDGPLDLLLQLVQRDGVDLRRLPLVDITREYLAALTRMQIVDLDLAGEFLVMAATLCELKSRELLPGHGTRVADEEEEDPREALLRRILLFQRYRQAAEELTRGVLLDRNTFRRPLSEADDSARPLCPGIDALELCELYAGLRARARQRAAVHVVEREPLRWRDALIDVLAALDDGEEHTLDELLARHAAVAPRVLTFLGVLELCRIGALGVHQREHLAPILLQRFLSPDQIDLSAIPVAL